MLKKLNGQGGIKKVAVETMLDDVTATLCKMLLTHFDKQNIPYTVRTHKPIYTVAEGEALNLPEIDKAAKTLFITDDKHEAFYLVTLPLDKKLDLKQLRAALGSRRLTMATEDELNELLGMEAGSVTPLGLLMDEDKQVQLLIDAQLQPATIAIPLFSNTQTIWLPCTTLHDLLTPLGHTVTYLEL